jgi:Holliday junction resolvase RusA-like endonuclease
MSIQGIEVLNFWVPGPPKTKGSLQPRAPRCHCCKACKGYVGQPQLKDSAGSARWRKLVAYQAEQAIKAADESLLVIWPFDGVVALDLVFGLDVESVIQVGAGDLDKLYRNVLDALTDAGVYEDDVQVVRLSGSKSEDEPGVRIRVVI